MPTDLNALSALPWSVMPWPTPPSSGRRSIEDHLDALLPQCEREHAAGDATADDEDALHG